MTAVCVNGWPAYTTWAEGDAVMRWSAPIAGSSVKLLTLPGPVTTLWENYCADWLQYVYPALHNPDRKPFRAESFDPRKIAGTQYWSAHAGGVAVDLDSDLLPQHDTAMTVAAATWVRKLVAWYRVIEWGGDWSPDFRDQMHTQLRQGAPGHQVITPNQVAFVNRQGRYPKPTPPTPPHPPKDADMIELYVDPNLPSPQPAFILAGAGRVWANGEYATALDDAKVPRAYVYVKRPNPIWSLPIVGDVPPGHAPGTV